jgi:DNA-binding transcriptional LysR family regulator
MTGSDRLRGALKLNDLHVFMAVMQAGSMNKAARLLNTTQPAVSRSIAALEQIVGARLLERTSRGVEPTESGRLLLDGGIAVFDDLRQTLTNIDVLKNPAIGSVRIGCSPLLAASYVAALIDHVSRAHPKIEFEVTLAPIETAYRDLLDRKVDLLITRKVGPVGDHRLVFHPLFDDTLVVIAGIKHPCAHRRRLQMADLADELWVLTPRDYVLGSEVFDALKAGGIAQPRATVITSAQDVRLSLVATGRYLTIFPASALRYPTARTDVRVLPVKLGIPGVPSGMVTIKGRVLNPVVRLVMKHAHEVSKLFIRGK